MSLPRRHLAIGPGLVLGFLLLLVGRAHAAIALREATCLTANGSSIVVSKPAAAQVDDLYVLTVTAAANNSDAIYEPLNTGWQWAGLGSANNGLLMASFWRRGAAGDPASWTFFMANGTGTTMAYGLSVFSGVDTVNYPFVDADETQGVAATSHPLPNSTGGYDGMMRFMAGGARGNVSQSISAGPTRDCNNQIAGASLLTAREIVASGTTSTRTVSRTASTDAIMHSFLIRPACSAGGLNLTDPGTISFPSRALTGANLNTTTTFAVGVDDQRASSAGWRLSASATPFSGPGGTLPANAASITSASDAAGTGRCSAPANSVALPVTLTGTATSIYNNATGTNGQGPSTLTLGARLDIPASTKIGTYSSTWTLSLVSGP